jgi:hypothetical protein
MKKFCLLAVVLCACGGDEEKVEPAIIVGGGIHDPGIDGTVHVYVIDDDTDAPIAGATVRVGTIEGQTDATGLFTAEGDLRGKQTVIAKATNYAASVWVGADGANITIPMTRATTTTEEPEQAELAGTIDGWDELPLPTGNLITVALVTYSQSARLGDDDGNNLPPPAVNSNICAQFPAPAPRTPCAWRINARAGTIAVGAALGELDTKGTQTEDDDEITFDSFALKQPIIVADGADQSGITLDMLPSGSATTASVSFGTPPSAFSTVAGIVGVELGETGILRIGQVAPERTSVVVPTLSAISGATGYEFLAFATEPVTDGTAGQSVVLRRGITSASAIAAGEWLNAPGGLASDRSSVSFNPSSGAFGTIIEIDTNPATGTGVRAMSIIVLDATTSVTLPVEFAPLPSGALRVTANALDAGDEFAVDDFEVETLIDSVQRLAGETIELN